MSASPDNAEERQSRGRVLVVEDDQNIRDLVMLHLGLEGLATVGAADGTEGLRLAKAEPFDLIVLDVMLPGVDGVTVCRAIRRDSPNGDVPILMLTARRDEADKVLGLESGADDYLTKPFGVREFVARVRALLRARRAWTRRPPSSADIVGRCRARRSRHAPDRGNDLKVDPARRHAWLGERDIDLTAHEFELLYLLASQPGDRLQPRSAVATGLGRDTHVTGRSADALVKRVRRKIEADPAEPQVHPHGVGCRLQVRRCLTASGIGASTGASRCGIILLLAVLLVSQAAAFLWLVSRAPDRVPARALQQSARSLAVELETSLAQEPGLDLRSVRP